MEKEMCTEMRISLPGEKEARKALQVLGGAISSTKRATVQRSVNKAVLKVVINASDFTAMRAMATSTLRDAKVFIDACNLAGVATKQKR
jgi:tRNA threonylcarbamoyladenosine modification (KEOPS) complex  Pcc1 subunit